MFDFLEWLSGLFRSEAEEDDPAKQADEECRRLEGVQLIDLTLIAVLIAAFCAMLGEAFLYTDPGAHFDFSVVGWSAFAGGFLFVFLRFLILPLKAAMIRQLFLGLCIQASGFLLLAIAYRPRTLLLPASLLLILLVFSAFQTGLVLIVAEDGEERNWLLKRVAKDLAVGLIGCVVASGFILSAADLARSILIHSAAWSDLL